MFRIRSQPPEIFSKELRYNQTDPVRTDINILMVSLKKKMHKRSVLITHEA